MSHSISNPSSLRVCPWWLAYTFDNPLRRLIHPAEKVLGKYVRPGMSVLDIGCGLGHFSLGMARLTGDTGRVIALDLQDKMLEITMSRAGRAGLDHIISPHKSSACSLDLDDSPELDFALAANVLHETSDLKAILNEVYARLRPGGLFYVMEPTGHLSADGFATEIAIARESGFIETERPSLIREQCVLLQKPEAQ